MVISHLGDVDVEGLLEEDAVAFIRYCRVVEEVLDDAAHLDNGYGSAVNELHV